MLQLKCKLDKDCPQYSKCMNITDGNQTHSLCKFGDFLCPEISEGYFLNENLNQSCIYVDATMYDLDEEKIKEGFSKDIKAILKTCGSPYIDDCNTEKCNKNSDCLYGMCLDHKCINENNLSYEIYRCSVDYDKKYFMKCKKANGMICGNKSECYSNICVKTSNKYYLPYYCAITEEKEDSIIFTTLLYILGVIIIVIIISGIISLFLPCIPFKPCIEDML
eukprot:jgi/Orpsp1_1/1183672/evm.model.c7180000086235.1